MLKFLSLCCLCLVEGYHADKNNGSGPALVPEVQNIANTRSNPDATPELQSAGITKKKLVESIENISKYASRFNSGCLGFSCLLGFLRVYIVGTSALYSKEGISKDNFQWSFMRSICCESGVMFEIFPFWGIVIGAVTKEFLNKDLASLNADIKYFDGVKVGGFMHLGFFLIEGGVLFKKSLSSKFKWKEYGAKIFIGVKIIKSCLVLGASGLLG